MMATPNSSSSRKLIFFLVLMVGVAFGLFSIHAKAAGATGPLPDPAVETEVQATHGQQTAVFAGGCFWGVQAVFQHVKGVTEATSGYAGGTVKSPDYETVSSGSTGHAESVKITFDPSKVSYGQLLKIFFSVAHDPTQLNRQGPDSGTQYRSVIFYANPDQQHVAEAYIAQLQQAKVFSSPIVTQVVPLKDFFAAEDYHQNYATLHPNNPYIAINDAPKVQHLRERFAAQYKK
jgi:peptide-methionine (S)-S-oxide reductase